MGIKMGMHNRISPERFHLIKAALAEGVGEQELMAKYDIKKTTLNYIKKSTNFYEYRLLTETLPAARKMPKVIAPSSGLEFEDFSYRKKKKDKTGFGRCPGCVNEAPNHLVGIIATTGIIVIGLIALGLLASLQ